MINFDGVNYSERRSEEDMQVISFSIRIYNEGSFCLPSLSMLILSLSAILTKDVPDRE